MAKFGAKDVMDVVFLDENDVPVLALNWCKVTNLESTADTSDATGGSGNGIFATWDYNTTANLEITHATISKPMLKVLTGYAEKTGINASVRYVERDVIATTGTSGGVLTMKYKIDSVSKVINQDTGVEIDLTNGIISGEAKTIEDADIVNGNSYIIIYNAYSDTGSLFTINAAHYPGYYKVVGTFLTRDTEGNDISNVLYMGKGRINSDFSLELSSDGDPSTFSLPVSIEKDGSGDLYRWLIA